MTDFSHLYAIQDRLFNEKARLVAARTENERAFREREVAAAEKEESSEYKFLGIEPVKFDDINDDELLTELLK